MLNSGSQPTTHVSAVEYMPREIDAAPISALTSRSISFQQGLQPCPDRCGIDSLWRTGI
jgi:hypothetical protein